MKSLSLVIQRFQLATGNWYAHGFKRLLDIVLSLTAILVLSPVLLVTAVLVRLKLGSPVLFKQERPGRNGKIFTIVKFRTMSDKRDDSGRLLPDTERLTKFGRAMRAASLDELPELFNILKGDMSVVGPRPLSALYIPYYDKTEMRRHEIRPGLTGLAQVNGRNALSWEEKFAYDVQYVDSITFSGDVKIILRTVLKIIKRSDIGQADEAPESFHIVREKQRKQESESANNEH